jgi:glutamyl-tRNA synthetase
MLSSAPFPQSASLPHGVSAPRVRFAPSPSGELHVGNVRTALYNFAYARKTGGTFVLRIEDTDRTRVTDDYVRACIADLRWLGLEWDEGPEVGGANGPYRQSERLDVFAEWSERFLTDGNAYRCYCTQEELDERRQAARARGGPSGYDGHCRELTREQVAAYEADGRRPVVRFRMRPGATTFTDLIRGEVTVDHEFVPDFVLVRQNGQPLYTLAVAVDDVLMKITHVLRGEDLLSSSPRQLAVYRAMGVPEADFPAFAHLPGVLGQDGQKLSKRNGAVSIAAYRAEGFLPEAVCNYLALLGWSPGDNREDFSLTEMARDFIVERVNRNAAHFDGRKLEAINGHWIRRLSLADFTARVLPVVRRAGLIGDPPSAGERRLIDGAAPLIQERIGKLTEAPGMLGFLLVDERDFVVEPEAAARSLTAAAEQILGAARAALESLDSWETTTIEAALRSALVDGLGLKPRVAFGPVRVAVTGRRISPPLFESIELLGRDRTLNRLREASESL